jgi:hypothetical protein
MGFAVAHPGVSGRIESFSLSSGGDEDPRETNNVIDAHPEVVRNLAAATVN